MEIKDQMTISETATNLAVSCIMPTFNRRRFIPQAINYFLRQDYASKELIVVDDGTEVVKDLIPRDDRIQYIRLEERLTVGAKRNLACGLARGDIIFHFLFRKSEGCLAKTGHFMWAQSRILRVNDLRKVQIHLSPAMTA